MTTALQLHHRGPAGPNWWSIQLLVWAARDRVDAIKSFVAADYNGGVVQLARSVHLFVFGGLAAVSQTPWVEHWRGVVLLREGRILPAP